MKKLISLPIFILTLILTNNAFAQIGTSAPTGTFTVKIVEVLDLAVTSGANNTFDFNSIAKLDAGIESLGAVTLTYKSNKPWFINVNAGSANFTGSSPTPMPASVVQYKLSSGGSYTPLSTTPTTLSGTTAAKNARGTASIAIDYKVNPGYAYAPATDYGLTVTYTISNL